MRGIKKDSKSIFLLSSVIPNKITDIKKTSIENSSPTMPIIDILGFKKINIIKK